MGPVTNQPVMMPIAKRRHLQSVSGPMGPPPISGILFGDTANARNIWLIQPDGVSIPRLFLSSAGGFSWYAPSASLDGTRVCAINSPFAAQTSYAIDSLGNALNPIDIGTDHPTIPLPNPFTFNKSALIYDHRPLGDPDGFRLGNWDGSGFTNITVAGGAGNAQTANMVYMSRDGARLAYNDPLSFGVNVCNVDGSNIVPIINPPTPNPTGIVYGVFGWYPDNANLFILKMEVALNPIPASFIKTADGVTVTTLYSDPLGAHIGETPTRIYNLSPDQTQIALFDYATNNLAVLTIASGIITQLPMNGIVADRRTQWWVGSA